jgi:hypothetical protein
MIQMKNLNAVIEGLKNSPDYPECQMSWNSYCDLCKHEGIDPTKTIYETIEGTDWIIFGDAVTRRYNNKQWDWWNRKI